MVDVLIVLHFVILRIDVFGMHIGFIILQVATIMEVHMSRLLIGPCLKCMYYVSLTLFCKYLDQSFTEL